MRRASALLAAALFVPAVAAANPFSPSALFVFGDSLSDGGNGYPIASYPISPPNAQRWSNGPVAVEHLAARLGLPLAPSSQGGTNYAYGGAATGQVQGLFGTTNNYNTTYASVPAPGLPAANPAFANFENTGLDNQVQGFLADNPTYDPATALFFLWGGPNDLLIASTLGDPSVLQGVVGNAVTNIAALLFALYSDGARNFLVPNMPDLSLTPNALAGPPQQQALLLALSLGFRSALEMALSSLEMTLPGINILRFDTFTFYQQVVGNPAAYGFTNATDACLTPGGLCANPSTYVSWDGFHPTTAAHAVLGEQFAAAVVPEPATLLLLGAGLAAAALARRRAA
jgi:phospholipase/lecithinase/hemolysin